MERKKQRDHLKPTVDYPFRQLNETNNNKNGKLRHKQRLLVGNKSQDMLFFTKWTAGLK